ncbi:hypothetical protein D9M71_646890 [compost metagenome]
MPLAWRYSDSTFGLVWMVVVEEAVSAWVQGASENRDGIVRDDDFLEFQVITFELIH